MPPVKTMIAPRPSRTPRSFLAPSLGKPRWAAYGALAFLLYGGRSAAQSEAQKPAPNVLLLVDSSGSMEFKTNGDFPTCTPGNSALSEKSRWIDLVEVLTGDFEDYSCWAQPRNTAAFRSEFELGGVQPYDYGYVNPYHRPLSNMCLYGPGVLPAAASPYTWPSRYVNTFPLVASSPGFAVSRPATASLPTYTGCADFSQKGDGLLDTYAQSIRFGLMTFDARVNAGTGLSGTSALYSTGIDGNWSYYVGSPVQGRPEGCDSDTDQEVGARNAAAPPWEGRMVAFGPPNDADPTIRNRWIQDVLLSTRPYGATPIAGQLDDARQFLYNDANPDPLNPSEGFGPRGDMNWRAANCRKTILILLTDGEPNLDLRPYCESNPAETTDNCPYEEPKDIVRALRNGEGSPDPATMTVETYVIGFALASVQPAGSATTKSCAALTDAECADPANNVAEEERSQNIQACCTLNEIAAEGGDDPETLQPRKAYFAANRTELESVFNAILGNVIQFATRTMPVFSNPGGDAASLGYKFTSAFDPRPNPAKPSLWAGVLKRQRYFCNNALRAQLRDSSESEGDDFAANVNSGIGDQRRFYTVIADGNTSSNTIRPFIQGDEDGLGDVRGETRVADGPSALADEIPAEAMSIDADTCEGSQSDAACRDLLVDHLVGLTNDAGQSRCTSSPCSVLGAIYHSVPTPVPGRPSELLRDESYTAFINEMKDLDRPSVLYTSTVDGFLHAFRLAPHPEDEAGEAVKTKKNNELWAFLPPAVLPVLPSQYPDTPAVLLDGIPIIKEVVASKTETDPPVVESFEREDADATAGEGFWRTVLVQGFGSMSEVGGGYFALDITEPDSRATTTTQEPVFRWQLTRDDSGAALFGKSGTPLITTVYLDQEDDSEPAREVAVAVLPGGDATPISGTQLTTNTLVMDMEEDQPEYKSTRPGRNYNYAEAEPARSLTIVRLDTGEVIRTFRPVQGPFKTDVWTETDLDAPITGQPKAYPETTGSVADRIYVGDRDGRLWRVDVSSQNPAKWTMRRMYDAFVGTGATEAQSQPIILPPVLSVDEVGDVTIAFATGTQDPDSSTNRVISLTERLKDDSSDYVTHLNWYQVLADYERVTGNMVLFNGGLYYSAARAPQTTTNQSCDVGSSKVYSAHYIDSADAEQAREDGVPAKPQTGPAPAPDRSSLVFASQPGLIFGVSLQAEPTCVDNVEEVAGNDTFGYGTVERPKDVTPGDYYLSYTASGNNTGNGVENGIRTFDELLPTPPLPVTFQSWALVYE
jgi:type IV pilus assembly protein PilY1